MMASSDSMFLFEIVIEEIKNYLDCKQAIVKANFPELFEVTLSNPYAVISKISKKKTKRKSRLRNNKLEIKRSNLLSDTRLQRDESILVTINTQELIKTMQHNELELSMWRSENKKIGSTKIPWSTIFIYYLLNLETMLEPVSVQEFYNIYDEIYYEKVATIKLNVKLTHFGYTTPPIVNNKSHVQNRNICKCTESNLGIIKTTYHGNKKMQKRKRNNNDKVKRNVSLDKLSSEVQKDNNNTICNDETTETEAENHNHAFILAKSKSFSFIERKADMKTVNYIFGDPNATFGNKVYCVNYFTVEQNNSNPESKKSSKSSMKEHTSEKSSHSQANRARFKFRPCDSECPIIKNRSGSCPASMCSLDMPEEAAPLISIAKCRQLVCEHKEHRALPPPPDERILLDLTNLNKDCCDRTEVTETIEEVVGGVKAKMKIGQDPCFCTCECTFGFMKKTTYCKVCGGYERIGEEQPHEKPVKANFPCPIYHKLIDKNKMKSWSTSGSESKKKGDDTSVKAMKVSSNQKAAASDKRVVEKKSVESEKDTKKCKKKKKDDRFKFNYGYKGIPPQIGHSRCALPCTGTLENVPKHMGWLWTAEDVPGMKFRPSWKPGATNKHVVRLLRMARNPGEVTPKKRRKDAAKKKRPLNRPLLIVHKKDGEFTVTMETMKTYNKPRAINQYPYEDKPVLTYTIGRTEEENRERRKKKEREQRRLERAQRAFIQSAFRDMCHEICLKTYQQALGILPDTEDPECTCYPAEPTAARTNMDVSCSCSEDSKSIGSDTDSDEWIVEFTPPCATFNQNHKGKKVIKVDNGSQYTYLDYRVKLLDRFGNPVPRFFKGPDGKQQCSDLGGFWSPDKKWLEINVDGYIAPDGRWAPNNFIGPSGEQVEAITGKFQTANNKWLVVGIDGYVDCNSRWRFYPKPRGVLTQKKSPTSKKQATGKDMKKEDMVPLKSEASWSCFGDATPKDLSKLGIIGHGHDKKILLATLREMMARGEDVKIPQPSTVFRLPPSKKRRRMQSPNNKYSRSLFEDSTKCKHSAPSDKGIIAVDDQGNKTYFRLKGYKNARPKQRLATLAGRGISLSSFHVPCFHSFISAEVMKKQQRDRLMALASRNIATQVA
ncbi:uncharacterized protein LOC123690900 isoform X1 [Colias croceus]|uniref:uncharacterized protein LOC123690900 isoform X1 n=1 Tax=Colias crocea TaxID=72248 RepID=UPI001E27FA93|nr:uncharacterized protein LOC123690900 isoform X1 [Colias croceus]